MTNLLKTIFILYLNMINFEFDSAWINLQSLDCQTPKQITILTEQLV